MNVCRPYFAAALLAVMAPLSSGHAAGTDAASGRQLVSRYADAIVGIELVVTLRLKMGDREAPPREQRIEVNGTVISKDGLTVTTLGAVDPQATFQAMGGAGGRGGDVRVRYWRAGKDGLLAVSNYGPGLQVLTTGGHSAQAGMPGAGGAGGLGQLVKRPTGIKIFRNPGNAGAGGSFATPSAHGEAGRFLIEAQAEPRD